MKAHILIVEDDPALAELLCWNFESEGFEVTHTPDGEEALLLASERQPDLIVLDWMIENLSGIEVCRRIRRDPALKHIPIIMLTARSEEDERIRGLETGADDYVTKPFSPGELRARTNAILRRTNPGASEEMLEGGDICLDLQAVRVTRGEEVIDLGPTEFRLLRILMERQGRAQSRSQLLDAVWGHDSEIEFRTVDVHIRRLRKALTRGGARDPIRTIRSVGYAFEG